MSEAADDQSPAQARARVSAVIPTRNRKELLRRVLHALQAQTVRSEIICVDDGSTDGTAAMLGAEFPQVRTLRREVSRGPAAARNAGARAATGEFLLTLDDDCVLTTTDAIERTLELFDRPEIAGVTLPFVNVRLDRRITTAAPQAGGTFVTTDYYAGMVILRRDNFLQAGGYREPFFMHHEEADLAIRLLDKRRFIRNGFQALIDHHESPVRDRLKLWRLGAQNAVLFAIYNVPWPWFPIHLGSTIVKTLVYAWRRDGAVPVVQGFCAAIPIARRTLGLRAPVRSRTYLAFRTLKNGGHLPLDCMQELLGHG
ncbi:MAG: glycosyltransferase family 2 protein [Verrucomicrobia bacterium]|nr:glycosyltransferase family 2 protein [Verrucomicrobiota bacterium]